MPNNRQFFDIRFACNRLYLKSNIQAKTNLHATHSSFQENARFTGYAFFMTSVYHIPYQKSIPSISSAPSTARALSACPDTRNAVSSVFSQKYHFFITTTPTRYPLPPSKSTFLRHPPRTTTLSTCPGIPPPPRPLQTHFSKQKRFYSRRKIFRRAKHGRILHFFDTRKKQIR